MDLHQPGPSGQSNRGLLASTSAPVEENSETMASSSSDGVRDELRNMRDDFERVLRESTINPDVRFRYYHAGIWARSQLDRNEDVLRQLETSNSRLRFLWAFEDGNHIHVVHDCANANGCCRCFGIRPVRRKCKRIQLHELQEEDISAIVDYYFAEGPKKCIYAKMRIYDGSKYSYRSVCNESFKSQPGTFVHRPNVEIPDPIYQTLLKRFDYESGSDCNSFCTISEGKPKRDHPKTQGTRRKRDTFSKGVKGARFIKECQKIEKKLKYICCAPISETINSKIWQSDPNFKYLKTNDPRYEAALNSVELELRDMSLTDIINFIENSNFAIGHPLWSSRSRKQFRKMYMPLTKSYNMLVLWCAYQFAGIDHPENLETEISVEDWRQVSLFVKELCLWMNGEIDRKYTMLFRGPSMSGKSMFADMIMDIRINVGVMGHYNKHSSFPLNMCVNKSMYYWNEPNIEPDAIQELKKITGGDRHAVDAKYKNSRTQTMVQVLITGNDRPFPNDTVYSSRIIEKNCKSMPLLAIANGQRYHPMALIKLIRVCENILEEDFSQQTGGNEDSSSDNEHIDDDDDDDDYEEPPKRTRAQSPTAVDDDDFNTDDEFE
uniref:SF3 helicase domain-containing protein n=1 Tax=Atrato Denso-like virus 1 TaxID=2689333 RepID=A0A6B9KGF6_9VIRU|nr:hypothetical protein [Atrato Denso-like virus 1]